MSLAVTFLTLLSLASKGKTIYRTCVPNSQFVQNERICYCDSNGLWNENSCDLDQRVCKPGQVLWKGCTQCICQETKRYVCMPGACSEETDGLIDTPSSLRVGLGTLGAWCTPFRSYYVDCSICVCPASGRTSEARCALDNLCTNQIKSNTSRVTFSNNVICLPKVMYIFPCVHCLCADNGRFNRENCIDKCKEKKITRSAIKCIPGTFYRKDCNICICPENGDVTNNNFCTNLSCTRNFHFISLKHFPYQTKDCHPNSFTEPRCIYCECNSEGNMSENACMESNCLSPLRVESDIVRNTCNPGELVPICMECFCFGNSKIKPNFCTNRCTIESKLNVLEKILKDNVADLKFIAKNTIRNIGKTVKCRANSIFVFDNNYCLCSPNGVVNLDLCLEENIKTISKKSLKSTDNSQINIDFNTSCVPRTFVEFDCNTCFCSAEGKIDPKWCTYDNCFSKKDVEDIQRMNKLQITKKQTKCSPGSIFQVNCNYCICTQTGLTKDSACTRNDCIEDYQHNTINDFICQPLEYYEIECNVCLCPHDGKKNVKKCTKNACNDFFLRTNVCIPGQLFIFECNVCICPPNGDKLDRVCTNHTCPDEIVAWKKVFKISQNELSKDSSEDSESTFDHCFPGEEFIVGCKLCICPDMGIRSYANCLPMLCNDKEIQQDRRSLEFKKDGDCLIVNMTNIYGKSDCTPGSMYIIRCQQCICPYMDNIELFCRPLPKGTYCEKAFPGFNYIASRRKPEDNQTFQNNTPMKQEDYKQTKYQCDVPGRIMDECFVCECEDQTLLIIEVHCFQKQTENCINAVPKFLTNKDQR